MHDLANFPSSSTDSAVGPGSRHHSADVVEVDASIMGWVFLAAGVQTIYQRSPPTEFFKSTDQKSLRLFAFKFHELFLDLALECHLYLSVSSSIQ